jgi:hypothetical protein
MAMRKLDGLWNGVREMIGCRVFFGHDGKCEHRMAGLGFATRCGVFGVLFGVAWMRVMGLKDFVLV